MSTRTWLLLGLLAVLCPGQTERTEQERIAFYRDKVRPILAKNCLACHNSRTAQAGLDVSSRESLLRGSENGPVLVPGDPERSHLYKVLAHAEQPAMPFKAAKLPDDAVAAIAQWIRDGVPYDSAAKTTPTEAAAAPSVDHWAFRKPARPAVPSTSGNPIDAFLEQARASKQLKANPPADPRTLIRRVYLDLTGLLPSPEDVRAFEKNASTAAYEQIVDRLLASSQYGERWGRHWLDVWRYSDWYGWRKENQVRYSQRHVWRWRDWTVDSLNANKGYDRMIREMLAGDELAPSEPDTLRATGYLARSWYRFNRNVWLQEAAEYTATSFMGITMKCARCHTHKYDPITHVDYYRFRAFFEPYEVRTDRVQGEIDVEKNGLVRAYDADVTTPTYRFIRGNEATPEKDKPLTPGLPAFFDAKLAIKPVSLPATSTYPDGREFVQQDFLHQAELDIQKAEAKLKEATAPADKTAAEKHLAVKVAELPALKARIAADRAKSAGQTDEFERLAEESRKLERHANFLRADEELHHANLQMEAARKDEKKVGAAKKRLEAAVKALNEASESYTPLGKTYPSESSGRRLALANWIAGKDNPLTARVAMNHMWLRHFGKALVPTVFNFGKSGKQPSHPELLDWLATEFMESGWDMKRMHRLMVTSRAYRMSTAVVEGNPSAAADPDNVYLWRMNTRRMEAEAVRDSLLQIAGKLDLTMGGPELDETKGDSLFRRSLYFRHTPDLQMEMLRVFDAANPNECFERSESVTPQQALALSNSGLSRSVARTVTASIKATSPDMFVAAAFDRVLGRKASASELAASVQFLKEQTQLYSGTATLTPLPPGENAATKPSAAPEERARESFVHALFNHNDFVTIR